MSKQTDALDYLVARCCEVDPACGVQLQGSVATGRERPESDIDMTVVVNEIPSLPFNELINEGNNGGMIRVFVPERDVNVDINWLHGRTLLQQIEEHGAVGWYMFLRGRPLHDPGGLARKCHGAVSAWFSAHPDMLAKWDRQQLEVQKQKQDNRCELEFRTQPEFCAYLASLRDAG